MAQHPQMHHDQSSNSAWPASPPETPVAFVFPGQGSQAVGMLKVRTCSWECQVTRPAAVLQMSAALLQAAFCSCMAIFMYTFSSANTA